MPSATDADAPPLEPPGVREASQGFRVTPVTQPSHRRRVLFPGPAWIGAAGAAHRRVPAHQQHVLDRDRDAVKLPARFPRVPALLRLPRRGEGVLRVDEDVGVDGGGGPLDAPEHVLGDLHR
jgi:hypothetical protein